jgi:RimJ/RimL family protein N-acetyltransferase
MEELAIPTLETERLRLRPLAKSDIDDYAALYADPEVLRYLSGGAQPWDRGRSSRHMSFVVGQWLVGDAGMWAVEHKETGAFLGVIGFSSPEGWPGFELAWALARRWWGHGYATEGARAALAYAFTVLEKDRVISLIHPENAPSIRVAERIGERLQGRIDHLGREMLRYGLDRESYLKEVARPMSVSASSTTAPPSLKELLLAESPRAEALVPPWRSWRR